MDNGRKGSYTVEATFVVGISVLVIFAMCYGALYIHDTTVIRSMSHCVAEISTENGKEVSEEGIKKLVLENLKKRLYLSVPTRILVKKGTIVTSIRIGYRIKVSLPFVKRILLKGKKRGEIQINHHYFNPVNLKWDYDILQEGLKDYGHK